MDDRNLTSAVQVHRSWRRARTLDALEARLPALVASTDAKERTGEAGKHIIKRRGRWASDVAEVYQRELVGVQLALSAALGDSCGEELEAFSRANSQEVETRVASLLACQFAPLLAYSPLPSVLLAVFLTHSCTTQW